MEQINGVVATTGQINGTLTDIVQINGEVTASRVYPIPTKLNDLADTEITNPQNNQILKYENGNWINDFGSDSGVTDYAELTSKPKINNVELSGNKSLSDLGIDIPTKTSDLTNDGEDGVKPFLTEHQDISGKADKTEIPTKTSDLTNDGSDGTKPFLTDHQDISGKADKTEIPTKTSELTNDGDGEKPFLTSHQDISNKADKATTLAGYGITDSYTKTETDTELSKKISEPTTEGIAGQVLATDGNGGRTWTTVSGGGGTTDYAALNNKPSINGVTLSGNKTTGDLGIDIPTKTSDLTNDGSDGTKPFLTDHQDISTKLNIADEFVKSVNTGELSVDSVGKLSLASTVTQKLSKLDSNGKIDYSNVKNTPTLDSWHKYNGGVEIWTVSSADTSTEITFKDIDNSKAYDLYCDTSDGSHPQIESSSYDSTANTLKYTVKVSTVPAYFKLREIN